MVQTSQKPRALCSHEIDLADLCSLRSYSKYLMTRRRQVARSIYSDLKTEFVKALAFRLDIFVCVCSCVWAVFWLINRCPGIVLSCRIKGSRFHTFHRAFMVVYSTHMHGVRWNVRKAVNCFICLILVAEISHVALLALISVFVVFLFPLTQFWGPITCR
jgi:hypothetical protein